MSPGRRVLYENNRSGKDSGRRHTIPQGQRSRGGCHTVFAEELHDIIENYDAIIVRSVTKVNAELLEGQKHESGGRAGNGIDNIDVAPAPRRALSS